MVKWQHICGIDSIVSQLNRKIKKYKNTYSDLLCVSKAQKQTFHCRCYQQPFWPSREAWELVVLQLCFEELILDFYCLKEGFKFFKQEQLFYGNQNVLYMNMNAAICSNQVLYYYLNQQLWNIASLWPGEQPIARRRNVFINCSKELPLSWLAAFVIFHITYLGQLL